MQVNAKVPAVDDEFHTNKETKPMIATAVRKAFHCIAINVLKTASQASTMQLMVLYDGDPAMLASVYPMWPCAPSTVCCYATASPCH